MDKIHMAQYWPRDWNYITNKSAAVELIGSQRIWRHVSPQLPNAMQKPEQEVEMLCAGAASHDLNKSVWVSTFLPWVLVQTGPEGLGPWLVQVCHVQLSFNRNLTIKIVIYSPGPSHFINTFQILCHWVIWLYACVCPIPNSTMTICQASSALLTPTGHGSFLHNSFLINWFLKNRHILCNRWLTIYLG